MITLNSQLGQEGTSSPALMTTTLMQSTCFPVPYHSVLFDCDRGLCNFMGARGHVMLFVWQGAAVSVHARFERHRKET